MKFYLSYFLEALFWLFIFLFAVFVILPIALLNCIAECIYVVFELFNNEWFEPKLNTIYNFILGLRK